MSDEWVTLKVVYDPLEAEMIRDLLESGGIEVVIRSGKVGPYPVNVGKMGEIKLLVRETELEEAERVITEVEGQ